MTHEDVANHRYAGLRAEDSIGYLINYAARKFARALAEALAPHGVSLGQWALLLVLWEEDGLNQKELSARVAVEGPTIVRTLDRLERDGFARRTPDPRDRRMSRIMLTEEGRALQPTLVPLAANVNMLATSELSALEQQMLIDLLRRTIAALPG